MPALGAAGPDRSPASSAARPSALVTGGGAGIGRATAAALAGRGYSVTIADIDPETATTTAADLVRAGARVDHVHCDVTSESSVVEAVEHVMRLQGRLDAAVNCAGVGGRPVVPAADLDIADFDRVVALNVRGTFLSMKHELRAMRKAGKGSIVNMSSAAGLVGAPGVVGYAASQHAVVGMTRSAALDHASDGIRVNVVCAGGVDLPMIREGRDAAKLEEVRAAHPLGRLARAAEVASLCAWLCSDEASFVTGSAVPVDGGFTAR